MTYRILLWFDMLEEEGKSTERVRGLFSRTPPLSKDFSSDSGGGSGFNNNDNGNGGGYINGNGFGDDHVNFNGNGFGNGDEILSRHVKIMVVKI